MILSLVMLLDWLGTKQSDQHLLKVARLIEQAVHQSMLKGYAQLIWVATLGLPPSRMPS
jgi:isocitrate/isopropylmalate dehydrogenase